MNALIVVLVIAVVVVLYVFLSPDPFASAIRAKIPGLQMKAANAIDSVEARTDAAQAAQESTVRKGRTTLYSLKIMLAESQTEIEKVDGEIADDQKAMALAHKNGDKDTFVTLVNELNRDTAYRGQLVPAHEQLVNQLKTLEVGVDEQADKAREIAVQSRVMVAQARVNDLTAGVNEALAGLNGNSADSHMEAARKILDKTHARAIASADAAEGLTPNERSQKKAQAYIKQAKTGADSVDANALWDKMSAGDKPA
jgi:hypothetical protein